MAAVLAIMEENKKNEDEGQQQGSITDFPEESLAERWLKQMKYENFMECARKMWDQFTSGAHVKHQRRLRAKAEENEKQKME